MPMSRRTTPFHITLNQPPRSPSDGRNRKPSPPTHRNPTYGASDSTGTPNPTDWAFTYSAIHFTIREPQPPTVPYAGVRAGELIGYRMWFETDDNQLCSWAHRFIWEPDATIHGDVNACVNDNIFNPIFGGTYSFFNDDRIEAELSEVKPTNFPFLGFIFNRPTPINAVVIGTIKMWGEVIEHEHGYRAEYAKINTLDRVIGYADLDTLRQRYRV